jgi:hypothetical protein
MEGEDGGRERMEWRERMERMEGERMEGERMEWRERMEGERMERGGKDYKGLRC